MADKIEKDEQAWKKQLTPNQYYVTRQKGTEPPFTGEYEETETPGTYKCVCCGQPLLQHRNRGLSSIEEVLMSREAGSTAPPFSSRVSRLYGRCPRGLPRNPFGGGSVE